MIDTISELKKLINTSENILLVNHIRMDGDALGSLGALFLILKKMEKNVTAINDEAIPPAFHFLGNTDIISPEFNVDFFKPDLIISLDAASIGQLGTSYANNEKYFKNTPFVVIDHHVTNEGFGDVNIIDVESSSTCELLYNILKDIDLTGKIDHEIATYLMMGIYTDTNIFYNSNTTGATFQVATELYSLGADQRTITLELFRKKRLNQAKLWGEALTITRDHANGSIVGSIVTKEMYTKTNTNEKDTSGLINSFFANIEGSCIGYLLCESGEGIKCSMRSNDKKYNVSEVAQKFGGGGHVQAAGFYIENIDIESLEKQLVLALTNTLGTIT